VLDSNLLGILSDEFDPWTMMESSPALDLGLRMGMASFGSIKLQTRKIDGDKQDMDLPVTWDGREGHVCNAFDRDQCQGGPQWSPEIQLTLVWSSCWGATGGAGRSTQR